MDDEFMDNAPFNTEDSLKEPLQSSEIESDVEIQSEDNKPSIVFLSTWYSSETPDCHSDVYGVTFLGRHHAEFNLKCQDFHLFKDLGDGWHLYVASDGAGSASQSHRGAKINCEVGAHLIEKLIMTLGWKQKESMPSHVEWQTQFDALCRTLKHFIEEKVESLDEPVSAKDFNATLLVMIVTPIGILAGHIGDGRMGFRDIGGVWHSTMTPHKGDEPNQTVFMINAWDTARLPALKMSGVFVPETFIIFGKPSAVCLLTDGCENACWECTQWDETVQKFKDKNLPFPNYWERLISELNMSPSEERISRFINFVDSFNEASEIEGDDRTLLFGLYSELKASTSEADAVTFESEDECISADQ